MKFVVTMNMPSHSGNAIHQVLCEYPVNGIEAFCKALEQHDFLIVDEIYKNPNNTENPYYVVGKTAINHLHVGKIKELNNMTSANRGAQNGEYWKK